jgi:hypothetical protein
MRRRVPPALCLLVALTPGACLGTMFTRASEDDQFFGWPLFEAVNLDVHVLATGRARDGQEWTSAFLGLPIDFVLDLVLLPADVVLGIAGDEKRRVGSFEPPPPAER